MERTDEWPRVHTCLHDWCPRQSEECKRCDAVIEILKKNASDTRPSEQIIREDRDSWPDRS